MRITRRLWIAIVALAGRSVVADDAAPQDEASFSKGQGDKLSVVRWNGENALNTTWKEMIGHQVCAEGIAWKDSKGFHLPFVIMNGCSIFFSPINPLGEQDKGTLISVVGTLRKDVLRKPVTKRTVQGFSTDFHYYWLEEASWQRIERVVWPMLTSGRK